MKCILCNSFSIRLICRSCQKEFLSGYNLSSRVLPDNLKVYSFYPYSYIEKFIKTKHTPKGSVVYKILAKNTFLVFAKSFDLKKNIFAVPIDDTLSPDYSHTAILAKELKTKNILPVYNVLRSKNPVSYSGKSLEYRLKNPRDFNYTFKENIDVILVDDIITTGTTLSEAKNLLQRYNVNVLFALTLADARL